MTWSPEKLERLHQLLSMEVRPTAQDMANVLGVSRNSVIGKVRRMSLKLPNAGSFISGASQVWTQEKLDRVRELLEQGTSQRQVAFMLGMCPSTVWRATHTPPHLLGEAAVQLATIFEAKEKAKPEPMNGHANGKDRFASNHHLPHEYKTLRELKNSELITECRFINDEKKYCGLPVVKGQSWCDYHFDVVYKSEGQRDKYVKRPGSRSDKIFGSLSVGR
jgi:hypothetical protein